MSNRDDAVTLSRNLRLAIDRRFRLTGSGQNGIALIAVHRGVVKEVRGTDTTLYSGSSDFSNLV